MLLGCDASRISHAIATASTFAGGLQQALHGDGMSKPLHSNHAAEAGSLAAIAASAGVTGVLDIFHGEVGFGLIVCGVAKCSSSAILFIIDMAS